MRGRRPAGPECVEHLAGSQQAKERLQVVLETLAGTCRVQEVCQRLGLSEPRFHQLRQQVLEAALERLEPRPAGRKPAPDEPEEEEVGEPKLRPLPPNRGPTLSTIYIPTKVVDGKAYEIIGYRPKQGKANDPVGMEPKR
jgi:hypothetical protein